MHQISIIVEVKFSIANDAISNIAKIMRCLYLLGEEIITKNHNIDAGSSTK